MSEQALYRKYRSQTFADVIGQEPVVKTLQAAIAADRVSHAYLFTGPRGVGKTTVARLLARSVNCLGDPAAGKPCNNCAICRIPIGSHLDLIEIDAASNRSIDEIRDLREKIGLAPAIGKYKVYIIDEVHMLTKEAFNALLKTLEEPPPHAIFILATTEAHKLPETVISRTQRFNFKPLNLPDLVAGLSQIAKTEKIPIEEDAISLLAAAGRGGFRDAISMLDQVAALGESKIDAATVRTLLGWSDEETIAELSMAIANRDSAEALGALDRMVEQGAQVGQIIAGLLDYWRKVMLVAVGTAVPGPSEHPIEAIVGRLSIAQIVEVIELLAAVSKSNWPNLLLEAALIRLTAGGETRPAPIIQVNQPAAKTQPVKSQLTPPPDAPSAGAPADMTLWPKALLIIKQHNNSLHALLKSCDITLEDDEFKIVCRFGFHRDRLDEPKNRGIIEQALEQIYGRRLPVIVRLVSKPPLPADSSMELVGSALDILGGEIVDE